MLITCNTANLNKAIQTAQRAILSRPSTPIFSGIHLIAKDNRLEVQGMDINIAISETIDANIEQEGEILVSSKHFSELIRKLPGEIVSISKNSDNKTIKVVSGKAEFQLLLMNEEDYPKFPVFEGNETVSLDDEVIEKLIRKTVFACSTDEARPLFTGILVEVKDGKVTFVGTNTHRLAIKSAPYAEGADLSFIIPARILAEIARNVSDVPEKVNISLLNNQVMITIGSVIIVSRLIEGKFPDYRKVIPPRFGITCKINVKDFAGAVERVALFSTEGNYSTIKMSFDSSEVVITSSSPDVGNGREVVSCATEGDKLNVAFNARYILDILKNLDDEEAIFSMNTSLSPAMVTSAGEPDFIYIVTPVRIVF